MIEVLIPRICSKESQYVINCLLHDFLGLSYALKISDSNHYKFQIGDRYLVIEKHGLKSEDYFNDELSTCSPKVGKVYCETEYDIVSIFGDLACTENEREMHLSVDIISSTFFMLTRWEEYINTARDAHQRFSAKDSIAYKYGFLERPVVNEYVELLWALLKKIGCTQTRKKWDYKLVPTHDVDRPFLFNSTIRNIRSLGGFVKRGRIRELKDFIYHYIKKDDPWDTHDRLMDLSEKENAKSHFFFLPKGKNRHDGRYEFDEPKVVALINKIKKRGHYIGLHPSYDAYNDPVLFQEEKNKLEEAVGQEVLTGRQHYLRFSVPDTWKIWNDAGMEWDSTMSYADHVGFRCGVCYPFPVFDIKSRKKLNLKERPLIAMEASLVGYEGLEISEAQKKIEKLKEQVRKYNGEFVFLYHNSAFFENQYHKIADQLLNQFYYD